MTNTDSFIQEVTEEVRQDRMFALWKKWGPLVLAVVVLIIAGAAFWSWTQARHRAEAEARGAKLLAVEPGQIEAEQKLAATLESPARLVAELSAAADLARTGKTADAAKAYREIAARDGVAVQYRDLALLQALRIEAGTADPAAVLKDLQPLMDENDPYRLLARELAAALELKAGDVDKAHADMKAILADPLATQQLRVRVTEMLTASGGTVPAPASQKAAG